VNVGAMRHRVTVQNFTTTTNALNQRQKTPTAVGEYWADIVSLTGRELVRAQQVNAEITHKVTMRYQGEIKASYTLLFNGRTFHVLWVDNVGQRNRELHVYCNEVVSA
jgi:SPP1 family predicted phage head-tail adaptor